MARKNTLGGKAPQTGNNVSHSHLKTRRQWLPNIQTKSLYSVALDRFIRLTIPSCVMRSVDQAGGLDSFLLAAPAEELTRPLRRLQTQIRSRETVSA